MGTGSKILFIEDEINLDDKIIDALEAAGLIAGDIGDRDALNNKTNGNIVIATSFTDAFERIISLGDGSEYEWIFLDRNLAEYAISSEKSTKIKEYIGSSIEDFSIGDKVFTKKFFDGFTCNNSENEQLILAGDYLFITLINAGVPIEKICFLTANNDSSVKMLEKSPYLHKKRSLQILDKSDAAGFSDLEDILKNSHKAKIRFLYRDIFNNTKVQNIWGPYIEDFIAILAKRYASGAGAGYKGDGIILRNMIETGLPKIVPARYGIRKYLNNASNQYNPSSSLKLDPYDKTLHKTWKDMIDKSIKAQKGNTLLWWNDKNLQAELNSLQSTIILDDLKAYDAARFFAALNQLYFGNSVPSGLPPKYIFSYMDNIYTITSEFSAHGKNATTTNALSSDGWSALLSGMLQIMQWVAK